LQLKLGESTPGTDVIILDENIFTERFGEKMVFFAETTARF
jgi:hypothetical protein